MGDERADTLEITRPAPLGDRVSPDDGSGSSPVWPLGKRLGFRFVAAYFVLYTLPFPLAVIPGLAGLAFAAVQGFWHTAGPWVGARLLGIEGDVFLGPTGSGDTTLDFIKLAMMVVMAGLVAAVWSWLGRHRVSHPLAARWLLVGARFYLGYTMLQYGLAKVIPTQFSPPSLVALLTPFGDSSPMGLVWKFMGHSPAYTIFSGLAETLGGVLLFFRRTRMIGAMVLVPVLTNVVMLNYAYDVPVKLYSSHLLLMAIGILAADAWSPSCCSTSRSRRPSCAPCSRAAASTSRRVPPGCCCLRSSCSATPWGR